MTFKSILDDIKEGIGILNPSNIITNKDKKFLLNSNDTKSDNNEIILKSRSSVISPEKYLDEDEKLVQHTKVRLFRQELKKQKNLEQILQKTENILDNINETLISLNSQNKFSEDWLSYYIDGASKISEEQAQHLWAKILAGEIVNPKTFSKRTLDALLRLSSDEAQLFEKICSYALEVDNKIFLINSSEFTSSSYFHFLDIVRLSECGLINSSVTNNLNATFDSPSSFGIIYGNDIIVGNITKAIKISIPVFLFTATGIELFKISSTTRKYDYTNDVVNYLRKHYKDIDWNTHQIIERNESHTLYVSITESNM